jgi:hypothetical protein
VDLIFAASLIALVSSALVVASCPVSGLGRWLAPCSMAAIMLGMIFGIRPLFTDRFQAASWYGYIPSIEDQGNASIVGVVMSIALLLGTLMARTKSSATFLPRNEKALPLLPTIEMKPTTCFWLTLSTALLYVTLLAAFAGPGVFSLLMSGRVNTDSPIKGVPEVIMIVPMTGAICASVLILAKKTATTKASTILVAILCTGISFFLVSQLGNRRFIIPVLLMPVISALIIKPVRIKLWHIIVGFVGLIFIAVVPMVRAAGARLPNENIFTAAYRYFSDEGLLGVLTPIFSSYDTEMYDYIALVSGPLRSGSLDYGMGRGTLLELFLHPLPSSLSPQIVFSDDLLSKFWGGGCGDPVCPVASVAGVLYFDGGLVFVGLGGLAFGFLLRKLSNSWNHIENVSQLGRLSIVILSSFILIATRTNTIYAAWWTAYTLLIGAGIIYFLRVFGENSEARAIDPHQTLSYARGPKFSDTGRHHS